MRTTPPPQPTPNTIVLLGAASLPQGVEKEIEEIARSVCIENALSTCDEVRYVSPSLAYIDFPYHEACRDFIRVTGGMLKVRNRSYKLQHSSSAPNHAVAPPDPEEPTASDGTVLDHPTDTLMVRQMGELTDTQVTKAFKQVVPRVGQVRLLTDRHTRKSKGFCFVSFYSVSEAETALARLTAMGSVIEGRKVAISFAKPQTHEQALESTMHYRNEQNNIQAQTQQALGGINADMWSSYLSYFNEEKEKVAQEKAARAAAAKSAREEAERFAEERKKALEDAAKNGTDAPVEGDAAGSPPLATPGMPGTAPMGGLDFAAPAPGLGAGGPLAAPPLGGGMAVPPASGGLPSPGGMDMPPLSGGGAAVPPPTGGLTMPAPGGGASMPPPIGGMSLPSPLPGALAPKAPGGAMPAPVGPGAPLPGGLPLPTPGGGACPPLPGGMTGPGAAPPLGGLPPAGALSGGTGPGGLPSLPNLPPLGGSLPGGLPNLPGGLPNLPSLNLPGLPPGGGPAPGGKGGLGPGPIGGPPAPGVGMLGGGPLPGFGPGGNLPGMPGLPPLGSLPPPNLSGPPKMP